MDIACLIIKACLVDGMILKKCPLGACLMDIASLMEIACLIIRACLVTRIRCYPNNGIGMFFYKQLQRDPMLP